MKLRFIYRLLAFNKPIKNALIAYLSAASGLSQGFIGDVESGKREKKYNFKHINTFAKVFKCSPKDFLPDHSL